MPRTKKTTKSNTPAELQSESGLLAQTDSVVGETNVAIESVSEEVGRKNGHETGGNSDEDDGGSTDKNGSKSGDKDGGKSDESEQEEHSANGHELVDKFDDEAGSTTSTELEPDSSVQANNIVEESGAKCTDESGSKEKSDEESDDKNSDGSGEVNRDECAGRSDIESGGHPVENARSNFDNIFDFSSDESDNTPCRSARKKKRTNKYNVSYVRCCVCWKKFSVDNSVSQHFEMNNVCSLQCMMNVE